MKKLYFIVFFGIFIADKAHSLICRDSWKDSDTAAQRAANERLLKSFQGDTGKLFFQNFKDGNIKGENSFIAIRGTSSIGRILKKIDEERLLIETIDSSGDLKKMEITIETRTGLGADTKPFAFVKNSTFVPHPRRQTHFVIDQGHPQLGMIFQAHQSSIERIDSRSLNIPKRNNIEQELKRQGYSSAYARGVSEEEEWIEVAKQLRELKPNPYETHIDYLKGKIKAHIEHIRKGITKPREEALKELERQAELKKNAVTYEWWVKFNFYLSEVLYAEASSSQTQSEDMQQIQNLINQFPFNILVPTTNGVLGVMLINETYPRGILPVGLLNEKKDEDALEELTPRGHYLHDIGHAENFLTQVRNTYSGLAYERFHNKLTDKKKNLLPEKRRKMEFGYFIMGHESSSRLIYCTRESIQESLFSTLSLQIRDGFNFKGLIDFSDDFIQRDRQVYNISKKFSEFSAPLAENP